MSTTHPALDREAPIKRGATPHHETQSEDLGKIRPELNLEKWPAIWRPAKSNLAPSARTLRRETGLANRNRITAEVKVGFTDEGSLTTEDQKTYYGLIKQWEDGGRTPQQTFFSIRGLSRTLRKKWGTNVIHAVSASLRRLRMTPFTWTDSYEDGPSGETIRKIEIFTILSDLKIVQRERDGVVNHAVGYFRFNDFILNNLLAHHTKPLLLDVIFGFRSEIAQLLYLHVDLIMADKFQYERRSTELFEDLGLKGKEYGKPSQRKRKLDAALREIEGVRLSRGGTIAFAALERTKDGKDYKVVFRKKAAEAAPRRNQESFPAYQPPPKTPLTAQAEEVVAHFHKLFHNVSVMHPQSKEVGQAVSLIANHGFEHAKYIVDFSHQAAAQTNYAPQTFGGILQYASRAVDEYEVHQREIESASREREAAKERRAAQASRVDADHAAWTDAETRLAKMSRDEYDTLLAATKAELLSHSTWLRGDGDSSLARKLIRSAMVREIMRQSAAGDASAKGAAPQPTTV